jgi:glycosyltransferase involved in cell wall biosynthesis
LERAYHRVKGVNSHNMKIVLLAPFSVVHTVRWANAFAVRGHEVHVITSHPNTLDTTTEEVTVHKLPFTAPVGYYLNAFALKRLLKRLRPDVLNAHYASGYGTLGRLCDFSPYVLSVWGSDVYDFPDKSPVHLRLIRKNLLAADRICSTSNAMAGQVRKICPELQDIRVTPFGVDTKTFSPMPDLRDLRQITIGTVKSLKHKYGIDILLKAFAHVKEHYGTTDKAMSERLRLVIVGSGPEEKKLKEMADGLKIAGYCTWVGRIERQEVPKWLNKLDIFAALSRSESFGVAIIEASACELPVIVSDAGGLPEVVEDGETGFVVRRENPEAAGKAMIRLINDPDLRKEMGKKGRDHVIREYEWEHCVGLLEEVLREASGIRNK